MGSEVFLQIRHLTSWDRDSYWNKHSDVKDTAGRIILSRFCLQLLNMELVLTGSLPGKFTPKFGTNRRECDPAVCL
jgi:hypothetical protein